MTTVKATSPARLTGNGNGQANTPARSHGNGHAKAAKTATLTQEVKVSKDHFDLVVKPQALTIQLRAEPLVETKIESPWLNPTQLDRPAFLMNFPFSYNTGAPNNPWMKDLKGAKRDPNYTRATVQFLELYKNISAEGLVYVLPTPRGQDLQDLVYTANIGIVLEHLADKNTVIISNFTSPPRRGETAVGVKFFQDMGYTVHVPKTRFEGEADLKHLYDNVYIGGYGIRSDKETFEWMEENFDMKIIKVREIEQYLYHLDCSIFPITRENTIICTELFSKKEIAELEKYTNILPVTADEAFSGICNSVRLPNQVLNSSHIHDLKVGTEDYQFENQKNRRLEDIASNLALEVSYFNLSEYHKSGALLSCMVMHLNRHAYKIALTA